MEKRLSKFIKNRRSRLPEPSRETTSSTILNNPSSPSPKRPSFFTPQQRAQSSFSDSNELGLGTESLRSFAYDSCSFGKPPTFVTKIQPGNGPVKLQASRRLSTGELIATTHEGALKDIKDGEYVVGKKERPASRNQRISTRALTAPLMGQATPTSPMSAVPTSPRTWSNTPPVERNQSMPSVWEDYPVPDMTTDPLGLGLVTSAPASYSRSSRGSRTDIRNSSARPSASRESLRSHRSSSTHDVNTTLAALKKAEYSRLTGLYGHEAATLAFTRLSSTPSSPLLLSPIVVDPPQHHDLETKELNPTRVSGVSANSGSCYDESTGTRSPQRTSYVSSHADSSTGTGPTSFADEEYTATREDIKSMVEQIRSTYLDAFDIHGSPPQRTKSRKKKKKTKSTSSNISGGLDKNRPQVPAGRQTWHPENNVPEIPYKRRVNSQPVDSVSRLPPIPASPTREFENESGIRRADSTTLGELMADMTRAQMKAQMQPKQTDPVPEQTDEVSKQNFSRPITPTAKVHRAKDSWLSLDSNAAESPIKKLPREQSKVLVHSRVVSTASGNEATFEAVSVGPRDDFEELYEDLFGKDADNFWSSSSLLSDTGSSLLVTHSSKATQPPVQFSTPRKPPRITSIPESPEYTHLADPRCPQGQFI